RNIFEWIFRRLQLSDLSDWYNVSFDQIDSISGRNLSDLYGGSLRRALEQIYPEIQWNPWMFRFERLSPNYWKNQKNQRKFFDWLYKTLELRDPLDWYGIDKQVIYDRGGGGILNLH